MSSLPVETVSSLKVDVSAPVPVVDAEVFDSQAQDQDQDQDQDSKVPYGLGFDDSYDSKAGPSSAGLEERGYFDDIPVLEKGNGTGLGEIAPIPAMGQFVLEEPHPTLVSNEGGWAGWTCVAGSWLVLFATSGYANAFGVFQAHYQFFGYPHESPSSISWIGSIQWFLQFSAGIVAGPLYDRGYFHHLVTGGGIIYIISLFMTSLCQELWQTILAQAVGTGLGLGLVYLPSLSVISEHFYHRRGLAMGMAQTGACIGVIPIMLNNLMSTHPFTKSVQYTAYLLLGCLLVGKILMRPVAKGKLVATSQGIELERPKSDIKALFKSTGYNYLVIGLCLVCLGVFAPSFYLQIFASEKGVQVGLTSYTVAIINAASTIGRLMAALGDYYGPLNLLVIMCAVNAILCFCFFGAATAPGLILISILYGVSSGVFNSITAPALMSFARTNNEIGSRMGVGFLICGFGALGGTPIIGILLERTGWIGPVMFSGSMVVLGTGMVAVSIFYQRREKVTWQV